MGKTDRRKWKNRRFSLAQIFAACVFFSLLGRFFCLFTLTESLAKAITDSSLNLSEFFIEIRCILLVAFKTVFKINNGSFHNTCVLYVAFHLGIELFLRNFHTIAMLNAHGTCVFKLLNQYFIVL